MFKLLKKVFDNDKYDLYSKEINKRNYNAFRTFMLVGSIISLIVFIMGMLFSKIMAFNFEFFSIFLYFILLLITSKFISKKHITIIFYIAITPIMLITILLGTFLNNATPSISIMVFICVLTIFILDKPLRIFLYISAICVVYCICCYNAKPLNLFRQDFIHLVIFYQIAIGVNFFTLHDRLESIENHVKYKEKSEIDMLTHIYNRGAGIEKIKSLIEKNIKGALFIIDIDNFKHINDTYGHRNGDEALKVVSKAIKNCFKDEDIVLRLGGDEFAIYAVGVETKLECEKYCEKLFDELKTLQTEKCFLYNFGISLGCSISNDRINDFKHLYETSDRCLYEAKNCGKGCYYIKD